MGYYILYGFLWVGGLLPLRILYFFSDIYFYLIYYLLKYRRRVVRANLQHAFPEKDLSEIIKIEKRYYRHLCDFFVEMYKMWHMSDEQIRRRCKFTNPEVIRRYFDQGKSVIGVLGHYGNWEWMSSYSLWENDADFLALYKPIRSKVTDRMMKAIRSKFGAVLVAKDDTLRVIARYRSEKKLFLAGFIGDQTPNVHNLNFWTRFLNQDTPVLLGTERIARKYNFPVVSVRMRKVKRGYYEVEFIDVCANPAGLEPGVLTEMHTRLLESFIREEPQYWLWSHKRWKHKKV